MHRDFGRDLLRPVMRAALGLGWGLLVLSAAPAQSAPASEGRFVPFQPLGITELYAKRMRFKNGEPMISVGIMEAQSEVVLAADGPARLMFDEGALPKTVFAPPKTRFKFKPQRVRPASVRYWVVVKTHPYMAVQDAQSMQESWRARGHTVRVFEVGTIVALRGNVLDTRERHVAIGGLLKRSAAEALMRKVFRNDGIKGFLHEELMTPPSGTIVMYDESGRVMHRAKNSVYFGTVEGGQLHVDNVEHGRGYKSHGRQDRKFWGHIYIALDRHGKLSVINSVGAEKLLCGLVPVEIFATAPLEALKAQAVTARGEIFSKLGHRHFAEPYHLCSEQHCQVYGGAGREREATNKAVAQTRGLLAVRPRKDDEAPLVLVDSVYSSTCGGFSEANELVWDRIPSQSLRSKMDGFDWDPSLSRFKDGLNEGNIRAWLNSNPPTACSGSSFVKQDKFRWKKKISKSRLDQMVASQGVGSLRDVEILGRGQGGRITGVRLVGTQGTKEILREFPVRRLFGNLNSGMFVMDKERAPKSGTLVSITFIGGGWGHGVGMCQIGAIGRAERGHNFQQILRHYYNGAVVERIY